ncbi:MAG TPA: histidine kinase [Flavisolibacter sp.]|jgi:sensor histidine kinase YesM|nr:histidine kinase [Flavisolibacter sp.]
MKRNRAPYIAIAIICVTLGVARSSVIEAWPWYAHVGLYFFQVAFLIGTWELIQLVNKKLEKYYSFEKSPVTRVSLQVLVSIIIFLPVVFLSVHFARPYMPAYIDSRYLTLLYMLILFVLLFLNFSFYAYQFFQEWKQSSEEKMALQLKTEKLEREKSLMQYHHLRNQVNPHFLFNTLTSLDGLIVTDPELASQFVRHLSKVYRYVLEHAENEVVSLQTELDFIQHYIAILQMKFNEGIHFTLCISDKAKEKGIAMVTLQMLIDNAIKHNMVRAATPLQITIRDEDDFLSVKNNKQIRRQLELSTKQGLYHLRTLYHHISATDVQIRDTDEFFEVKLPLL